MVTTVGEDRTNHSQEFEKMNGVLVFDAMMDCFDPDLVKYQYHLQNPAGGIEYYLVEVGLDALRTSGPFLRSLTA